MQHRVIQNAPNAIIKVDLDERAFLFPANKLLTQLQILVSKPDRIKFEGTFAFNSSRANPELFELSSDETRDFSRKLVDTVYRAQPSTLVAATTSLTVNPLPNGYVFQFGSLEHPGELYLSTNCIWRVCGAIARAADFVAPISSN